MNIPDNTFLTTITIARKPYTITTEDKFMDNGSCVQLLTQQRRGNSGGWGESIPTVITKKALTILSKFEKIEYKHKYGKGVSIFSLTK